VNISPSLLSSSFSFSTFLFSRKKIVYIGPIQVNLDYKLTEEGRREKIFIFRQVHYFQNANNYFRNKEGLGKNIVDFSEKGQF
jgi:hypothetical protein